MSTDDNDVGDQVAVGYMEPRENYGVVKLHAVRHSAGLKKAAFTGETR